nr:membrane dipeptidase [Caldilineaceae bacterium]
EEMSAEVAAQVLKGLPPAILQQFQALPPTQDFASVADFPNLTLALLAHGYEPAAVRKITGGNWLHLYAEVWQR